MFFKLFIVRFLVRCVAEIMVGRGMDVRGYPVNFASIEKVCGIERSKTMKKILPDPTPHRNQCIHWWIFNERDREGNANYICRSCGEEM